MAPPQHTLDAYLVGVLITRAKIHPRESGKSALTAALAMAHRHGYAIPKAYHP